MAGRETVAVYVKSPTLAKPARGVTALTALLSPRYAPDVRILALCLLRVTLVNLACAYVSPDMKEMVFTAKKLIHVRKTTETAVNTPFVPTLARTMRLAGVGLGILETVAIVQLYLGPTHAQQITEVVTFMQFVIKMELVIVGKSLLVMVFTVVGILCK